MTLYRFLLSLVWGAAGLGLLRGAEVTVFAAASLADALKEIAPLYRTATGHSVRYNLGASGTLARQVREGAPADVFFSADELRADQLEKAGLLVPDSRRSLLANVLVLVVSRENAARIENLGDLASARIRRVALGEPATVPVGTYTKEHLQKVGLWGSVKDKLVPLDNARAVLAAVEAGNADAGFVYQTDALISKQVRIDVRMPPPEGPKISYSVAVIKGAKQAEAAQAFVDFLAGAEAQAVFARCGFSPTH